MGEGGKQTFEGQELSGATRRMLLDLKGPIERVNDLMKNVAKYSENGSNYLKITFLSSNWKTFDAWEPWPSERSL